jgi:23S rRNA (cytosine1962-C5)-methyltransferase
LSELDFRQKLQRAARKRSPLRKSGHTNAYRLFHADADGIPGVTVDWFDGVAVASLYRAWGTDAEKAWVAALAAELECDAVYLKRRPREASRIPPESVEALAPEEPAWGRPVAERTILENGLRYRIQPAQGLAVGLYLDMRDARQWVREQSRSRRLLNCFAYTCAFGVCAKAGGADRVVNVDLSRRALDWGEQNARLNGQPVSKEDYVSGDVFDWLGRFRKRDQRFDLVVLDPPSFATSKGTRFSASSDWPRLIERATAVVDRGGSVLACCNQASLSVQRFENMVRRGFEKSSRGATLTRRLGASEIDFPSLPGAPSALKVLAYQLD